MIHCMVSMLTNPQKKHLKTLAHALDPVVIIGANGLTRAVLDELERAIAHHELIKVRVNAADRGERDGMIAQIARNLSADPVQRIGHVAVFYRRHPEQPRIQLP
jgi:RNA-binding protein